MSEPLSAIRLEREGHVALITLNRPERFNAYTVGMGVELFRTLAELDVDEDVRAIVITGEGKHFCAGADLEAGGDTFAGANDWQEAAAWEAKALPWNRRTPIIVAINGAAVGIGATLPLQWDIRLASERARIGFVFTRRGIIPEAASSWILPRLIGFSGAMDLLITGRMVDAEEALRLGLVSRVVSAEALLSEAKATAHGIAIDCSPAAVATTRRLLWRQLAETDVARGKDRESDLFYAIGKQADAAEGVNSFLEKRPPEWTLQSDAMNSRLPDLPEP